MLNNSTYKKHYTIVPINTANKDKHTAPASLLRVTTQSGSNSSTFVGSTFFEPLVKKTTTREMPMAWGIVSFGSPNIGAINYCHKILKSQPFPITVTVNATIKRLSVTNLTITESLCFTRTNFNVIKWKSDVQTKLSLP